MTEINKTFREMVDHYFFQLAEEEDIDRDALTAEQQLALNKVHWLRSKPSTNRFMRNLIRFNEKSQHPSRFYTVWTHSEHGHLF